jgi:hypothetical protein
MSTGTGRFLLTGRTHSSPILFRDGQVTCPFPGFYMMNLTIWKKQTTKEQQQKRKTQLPKFNTEETLQLFVVRCCWSSRVKPGCLGNKHKLSSRTVNIVTFQKAKTFWEQMEGRKCA